MGGNYNFLQPPGLAQEDLHLQEAALMEKQKDDHLISLQAEPLIEPDNARDTKRHKRAAVKKNLASHSYHGSSMIAGQSADFPGSVIDSKYAIQQAIMTADKLRYAERPRHRSPFPQSEFNETLILQVKNNHGQVHNTSYQKNPFMQNTSVIEGDVDEKIGVVTPEDNVSHKKYDAKHIVGNWTSQVKRPLTVLKKGFNASNLHQSASDLKILKVLGALGGTRENLSTKNPTKARQHLHNVMENDLNESVDRKLIQKGNYCIISNISVCLILFYVTYVPQNC